MGFHHWEKEISLANGEWFLLFCRHPKRLTVLDFLFRQQISFVICADWNVSCSWFIRVNPFVDYLHSSIISFDTTRWTDRLSRHLFRPYVNSARSTAKHCSRLIRSVECHCYCCRSSCWYHVQLAGDAAIGLASISLSIRTWASLLCVEYFILTLSPVEWLFGALIVMSLEGWFSLCADIGRWYFKVRTYPSSASCWISWNNLLLRSAVNCDLDRWRWVPNYQNEQ